MNCKFCNALNDEDAVYCINCGKKLDGKLVCPSCGMENDEDAQFCKECGKTLLKSTPKKSSFSKEKGINLGNFILKIVSVSMTAFIILFSFGACFSPFLTMFGKGVTMFDFIKALQEFKPKPAGTYGADFYLLGNQLPNIICLCGVCIALIGCFVAVVYGSVKAIQAGTKKQIPNLDNIGLLATCSLLIGMLFSGLSFMYSKTSIATLSGNYSLGYGGIVLAAVSLGLAWYFLNYIAHFVLDLIQGLSKKEILNKAFKFGEAILLCVILFNLGSSFLSFTRLEESWSGGQATYTMGMSVVSFFAELSSSIYTKTTGMDFIFSDSKVAGGYYFAMVIFIVFIIVLIAGVSLIGVRLKNSSKDNKASLGIAVPLVGMALVELILTIVATKIFAKPNGVFDFVLGIYSEEAKAHIGSSIIVFTVFAILLLALEITWMVMNKKIKDEKGKEDYAV